MLLYLPLPLRVLLLLPYLPLLLLPPMLPYLPLPLLLLLLLLLPLLLPLLVETQVHDGSSSPCPSSPPGPHLVLSTVRRLLL